MKGFTFPYGRKDVFVSTELVNKTQKLVSKILKELVNIWYDMPDNMDARNELLHYLQKAECDIHTLSNGRQYYEIHGKSFGGKGSFVDDGNTIIIHVD